MVRQIDLLENFLHKVLEPFEGNFYFFDSLGFSKRKANRVLHHWR